MILTPHLLVGAALAAKIHPFTLAATLAILSHYVLDAVPHWDYLVPNIRAKNWLRALPEFLKVFADFFSGIILIFLLAKNPLLPLLGGFFAVLPDAVIFFTIILAKNKPLNFHEFLHGKLSHWFCHKKIPLFWKVISQIGTIAIAIFLLS